jgi:hypothetical protein
MESSDFFDYLNTKGYRFGALIVNRCLPQTEIQESHASGPNEKTLVKIQNIDRSLVQFYQKHAQELKNLESKLELGTLVMRVEDSDQDIWDLNGLEKMAQRLRGGHA